MPGYILCLLNGLVRLLKTGDYLIHIFFRNILAKDAPCRLTDVAENKSRGAIPAVIIIKLKKPYRSRGIPPKGLHTVCMFCYFQLGFDCRILVMIVSVPLCTIHLFSFLTEQTFKQTYNI